MSAAASITRTRGDPRAGLWVTLLWALVTLLIPAAARAATALCLEVRADSDEAGVRTLIESELRHHPSHAVVPSGCESTLRVEVFSTLGVRYVTARVNQEVPVRHAFSTPRELADALSEALRQVLQHDPVYLARDLNRLNVVWRTASNLLRRGHNTYRIEGFQFVSGVPGQGAVFAGGAAFSVSRAIESVGISLRVYGAGSPGGPGARAGLPDGGEPPKLRVVTGGDVGLSFDLMPRRRTSLYLGPGFGVSYQRYEGFTGSVGAPQAATAEVVLASLVLRAGVRFLRVNAFDCDAFVQGYIPFTRARDPDTTLVDAYTPMLQLGMGVGF